MTVKKLLQLLTLILLLNLSLLNWIARAADSTSTSEQTVTQVTPKNPISNKQDPKTTEKNPMQFLTEDENIKPLDIIGYKFVYQNTNGSFIDTFDGVRESLKAKLDTLGITPKNFTIIYLDYAGGGYANKNNNIEYPNITSSVNDASISINLRNLETDYSPNTLLTKRKVLVGFLLNKNTNIDTSNDKSLMVMDFNFKHAQAFQYISPDYYTISINKSTDNTDKTGIFNKTITDAHRDELYPLMSRIQERLHMMSFMNLAAFKNIHFFGLMELYSTSSNTYIYLALPPIPPADDQKNTTVVVPSVTKK